MIDLAEIKHIFDVFTLSLEVKYNPDQARVPAGNSTGGQFTSNSANAVASFQSVNFDAINNELRYDKPDRFKEVIEEMDKISTDVTNDTLYRGFDSNFTKQIAEKYGITDWEDVNQLNKLVGKTLTDKGFMSTSRVLKVAADFARDKGTGKTIVIEILGKKTGIEVSRYVNNYRSKIEKEFILKRGSSVLIKRVTLSKTGKIIFYTQIL